MGERFKKLNFKSVSGYSTDAEENQRLGKSTRHASSITQIQHRLTEFTNSVQLFPVTV